MINSLEAARKAFSHVKIEMVPGVVEVSVTDPRGHSGKGHVKLIEPEKWQVAIEIGMLLATEIYAGDKGTHEYAFQCVVCKMFFDSTVKHTHTMDNVADKTPCAICGDANHSLRQCTAPSPRLPLL